MRGTELMEFLNETDEKRRRQAPYSHINITPELVKLRSEYRRLMAQERCQQEKCVNQIQVRGGGDRIRQSHRK